MSKPKPKPPQPIPSPVPIAQYLQYLPLPVWPWAVPRIPCLCAPFPGASSTYSHRACLNNYSLASPLLLLPPPRLCPSLSTFIVRHVRCEFSALATYHCLPT
ncbi:hypothetical protein NXS19_010496 [Fusarium pseudograminearum]|nr:hypothetical protein NXS19_010496 [Fusarium pseudograminearum]